MMKVKVLTIFPELFPGFLGSSLTGKALNDGLWSLQAINIRDYAFDKHGSVDDTPCGGGAGMVMRADVLGAAIKANHHRGKKIIYMSPRGKPLTQALARELSLSDELTILCGRFEGVDQRVLDAYEIEEISIGDYILTGGEQAAQIMLDAIIRLIPGVLGNSSSIENESFETGLLEHPQYTRPIDWDGRKVPEVLLSGNHKKIEEWKKDQSLNITKELRPDLLASFHQKGLDYNKK